MRVLYTEVTITPYTHALFERFVAKGCEVTVVLPVKNCGDIGKNVKTANEQGRYNICYSRVKKMWYGKSALIDIKQYIEEEKPDILVTIWPYMLHLYFDRSILSLLRRKNVRLVVREIPFQVPVYGDLTYYDSHPMYDEDLNVLSRGIGFKLRSLLTMHIRRFIYKRAAAAMCYYSGAKDIVTSYGLSDNAFFYGNASDTDALSVVKSKIATMPFLLEKKPRVIHVGRLVKWKRVDLLIRAFHRVVNRHPTCELLIIGDGPEKPYLEGLVRKLFLEESVQFVGGVYDPLLLGRYMTESSVYVLAGMGGLSINDAMSFSLPIICSVCDGTEKDLVQDGFNGYFFNEGNESDLSDKLDVILSNPSLAQRMGENSRLIIENKANLDLFSDSYLKSFEFALSN